MGHSISLSKINNLLIILFIVLTPTQLGKHFFFDFSYISGIRIDYLAPTLYLTDILIGILIIINFKDILYSVIKITSLRATNGSEEPSFFVILNSIQDLFKRLLRSFSLPRNDGLKRLLKNKFVILLLLILVNILFSLSKPVAFYKTIKFIEIIFLFFIIQKEKIKSPHLLFALLSGTTMEFLLSLLQFTNKHSLQGIFYFLGERYLTLSIPDIAKASLQGVEILRPYGTFSHPNSLAGFYLLLYFFTLVYKKFNEKFYFKNLLLLLCTLLIFLSFSKIAIGTFLFLNLLYITTRWSTSKCKFCLVSRIVIFIVLAAIFFSAQGDPLSGEKRITLINNSLEILWQNPVFGVGLGNYLLAQSQFPIPYSYHFLQPVHNIFLLFLTEAGIILSVYATYLLYNPLKKLLKHKEYFYPLTAVVLTGMLDHYWLTLQQNMLLLPVVFALLWQDLKSKV